MLKKIPWMLLLVVCGFRVPQQAPADSAVIKIAENQLGMFLAKIPPGHDSDYGFGEQDKLENCEIGKPYRLVTFTHDFYSDELIENISYLEIKNEWRVPVRLDGQNRVLLTVSGNPGNLSVSEIGGADLAKELQGKSMLVDAADGYFLLRVAPLAADFFVSERESTFRDAKFIPLASAYTAIPSLSKAKKKTFSLDEVQQMVKEAVKNLQPGKAPAKKPAPVKHKSRKIKMKTE